MTKRKKHIIILSVIGVYLLIAIIFISLRKDDVLCKSVEINFVDTVYENSISKDKILENLYKKNKHILGYPLAKISTDKIEIVLDAEPEIESAEVYKTLDGLIKVNIKLRRPLVKVINAKKQCYYIDENGVIMDVTSNFTANVIILNGNIKENGKIKNGISIIENKAGKKYKILNDAYTLASFINKDAFWKSQIEQIYVNSDQEFELVPRIGMHLIVLGTIDNYEEKFENLRIFYDKALKKTGWNKYSVINLKYKNQVVCSLRKTS